MNTKKRLIVVAAMTLLVSAYVGAQSPAGHSRTETDKRNIPTELLRDIASNLQPKDAYKSTKELYAMMDRQWATLLTIGVKAENDHPKADNLHQVRGMMLRAAMLREKIKPADTARHAQMLAIAARILATPGDVGLKAQADFIVTRNKAFGTDGKASDNAEKLFRTLLARYKGGKAEADAVIATAVLAKDAKLDKLLKEMTTLLHKKYSAVPQAINFLIGMGQGPMFRADLKKLDGSPLRLPDDLLGKVVVIDFWATWCPPCIRSLPHMKKVYAAYKSKGVEFVGISLDRPGNKAKLTSFVRTNGLGWLHTYSGKGWRDPTARKFNVGSIPSIWVIGKDGRIASPDALSKLEKILDKALAVPTTKPAAQAGQ